MLGGKSKPTATTPGINICKVGSARNSLEIYLELRDDKWGMVNQKIGKKVLKILGGNEEDALGIGAEGNRLEFWLRQEVDTSKMKLGGMSIMVEEGIIIKSARALGTRRVILKLQGVPFNVSDREVLELGSKLGKVGEKGVRYMKGDEELLSMDRFMDIELKKNMQIPPKIILGNQTVRVNYPGQMPCCGNCLQPRRECEVEGFAARCRAVRPRANLTQITNLFYNSIGFNGEPTVEEEEGNEQELAREEQEKAVENTERTPLKERGQGVHGGQIDGIILTELAGEVSVDQIIGNLNN